MELSSKEIIVQATEKMKNSIHALQEKLKSLRTNSASIEQYKQIQVAYYGTPTPLNQVANISIPESRLVVIKPWDASVLPEIEKAILSSDLSVNPQNNGKLIRIVIPPLTDETRAQNIKQAKELGEEIKVGIRNTRRTANDKLKHLEHDHEISEDELATFEEQIQKLTDTMISQVQQVVTDKEKEILLE